MLARLAGAVGKGVFAGVVGTAAMTLSSTLEAKARGRGASHTPAEALCKLLGVETLEERYKTRITNVVHWGYGIGLGGLRGVIAATGRSGPVAAATFLGTVWISEQILLPALDLSPPITQWGAREIASDTGHHAVYAVGTSLAYDLLDRT